MTPTAPRRSPRFPAFVLALAAPLSGLAAETAPYGPLDGLKIARPQDTTDAPSTPPPAGALRLLEGGNLDQWVSVDGKTPAPWTPVAGGVQVRQTGIKTKRHFGGHFKLHVEFRVPYLPDAKGQARGN